MSIQPLESPLGSTSLSPFAGVGEGAGALSQGLATDGISSDAISRTTPPWLSGAMADPAETAMFGPLPGLLQQLMQMLQQFMGGSGTGTAYGSGAGCPPYSNSGACPPSGKEQFFTDASGASEGDPHLSFNGSKWNSMVSHPNLLNSDSIPGGFKISTNVTSPNARGVTRNQSATVTMNNGQTTISMNKDGQASITSFGQSIPISAGQTVQLGNGSSVTCKNNGALCIDARNGSGGSIDTTLSTKKDGVDVAVNAHDVDLGGALVRGGEKAHPGPIPSPVPEPVSGPVTGPVSDPIIEQPPVFGGLNGFANPFPILNQPNPALTEPALQFDQDNE